MPMSYNIKKAGLDIIDERGFNDRELWIKRIGELAERADAILLHVGIDIMDSRYVPAFKFPLAPGGQTPEAVMRNIKDVMATGKVIALTVMDVCFESEREGHEITYLNAMRILGTCLENWKETAENIKIFSTSGIAFYLTFMVILITISLQVN